MCTYGGGTHDAVVELFWHLHAREVGLAWRGVTTNTENEGAGRAFNAYRHRGQVRLRGQVWLSHACNERQSPPESQHDTRTPPQHSTIHSSDRAGNAGTNREIIHGVGARENVNGDIFFAHNVAELAPS